MLEAQREHGESIAGTAFMAERHARLKNFTQRSQTPCLMARFSIFPDALRGRSGTKAMLLGTLYFASREVQWARNSVSEA